ncbi:hypothetical protein [Arthrobacter sp. GMC3]|uniref:hypothetical protein n=1 Tax=Arthrobacter sp. GMC3 TaxID=2058894 RepID=UPI000CE57AAE|nr:hypothetical protein [Arthrobacter sp. GMC3]
MPISIKQFIDNQRNRTIAWGQCLAAFWLANTDTVKGEPYSAVGACDLWTLNWDSYDKAPTNGGIYGSWGIWSGSYGAYVNYDPAAGRGYGHVALFLSDNGNGTGQFMSQNPGPFQEVTLSYDGLLGFLRGQDIVTGQPTPAPPADSLASRTVTNAVAWVRTAPDATAPLAPEYPEGLAQGATLAVRGFVTGQDPYGTGDNAWYLTRSGYFVWANAAENTLEGLPHL